MLTHKAPVPPTCAPSLTPCAHVENSPETPAPDGCQPADLSFDTALRVFVAQHGGRPLTEHAARTEASLLADMRSERHGPKLSRKVIDLLTVITYARSLRGGVASLTWRHLHDRFHIHRATAFRWAEMVRDFNDHPAVRQLLGDA